MDPISYTLDLTRARNSGVREGSIQGESSICEGSKRWNFDGFEEFFEKKSLKGVPLTFAMQVTILLEPDYRRLLQVIRLKRVLLQHYSWNRNG